MICHWFPEPTFLFYTPDLPGLLFYAHIPAMIIACFVGFYVFFNARYLLLNRLLFAIAMCFALWVFINLLAWTNIHSDVILFSWTFFGVLQALISVLSIYFIYVFTTQQDISLHIKSILSLLLLPVLLLASTNFNVGGFNLDSCDAFDYEGVLFLTYYSFLGLIAMIWIAVLLYNHWRQQTTKTRNQTLILGVGIELFLFSFFGMVYLGSMAAIADFYDSSQIEFYGLFGMTFFMVVIAVLIVRYKTFNVGAQAAEVLVIGLLILIASQYTYANSTPTTVFLTTLTLILSAIAGIFLLRSVYKEIEQRSEVQLLSDNLQRANKRLRSLDKMKSEFVSIASHQLRSPLTSIRGYASMLSEGAFGKLPQKAQEAINRIADSSTTMTSSIEDYLNVSRIEAGNMKYELSEFKLAEEALHIVDDKRSEAIKKGLLLLFKSKLVSSGVVQADLGKTRQILHNLINNALKYTPKGTITVLLREDIDTRIIYVDITDTGIGIKADELEQVFGKFQRAKNANAVNVTGTGLGLFVAHKMAKQMGGDITVTSGGDGLGSTFVLSLPMQT